MIEEIRDLLQSLIVPQLEGINSKFDVVKADIRTVETKVDSFRNELLAELHRVEGVLSTDLVRLEQKMDTGLSAVNAAIESQRRELLAEIRAAMQ